MARTGQRWTFRSFVPVLVPAVLGVVVRLLGHPLRASILWAVAGAVLLLVVAEVPVERYVARFGAVVAHLVGVVATGIVGLLLVVAGGVGRLFGRDPLTPRRLRGNGWQVASSSGADEDFATSPFGVEPGKAVGEPTTRATVRWVARSALLSIGAVAAIVVLDLTAGLGWEALKDDDGPVGTFADAVNLTGSQRTVDDPRARLPAMAAYPWADDYFREVQLTPSSYWPFTESRPRRFDGTYVHIDDWSRRSYVPRNLPEDAPVVWMFGGSTTWGEGQRDDFTIASELSKIAERAGTPIRIVNYGQRGWTHFQEMILFEQLVASKPKPDLAIFYDGANEINAQTLSAKGVPTHTLVDQYAELVSGGVAPEFTTAPRPSRWNSLGLIWDEYTTHSAIRKVIGRLHDVVDPAAGAAPVAGDDDRPKGLGQNYAKTVADARNAVSVYERGRRLTESIAEDHGVRTAYFWQPVMKGPAEEWANAHMTPPTVNISDALDAHQEVYIDGGHTNEKGAAIVAERIWRDVGPSIRGAYEN